MNKQALLQLARESIKAKLENKQLKINESIKKQFSKKQACFVTLIISGELRGCIGSLVPRQPLYQDIIENAINAAFNDPRFPALTKQELNQVKIEISILTIPKKLDYKDEKDLLKKIKNKGVIIKQGWNQATYLPQVWEQLPTPEQFISSLCMKAGLSPNIWKTGKLQVQIYSVEKIEED